MLVGVNVNVGGEVSEGWGIMVSVEVKVGWGVAVPVGEGSGLIVQVGSTAGIGAGWMNVVSTLHPIDASAIADIVIIVFCKMLQRMVEVPKDAQTIEREPGGNDLDDIGFLCDNGGKPACGDHFHCGT